MIRPHDNRWVIGKYGGRDTCSRYTYVVLWEVPVYSQVQVLGKDF